MRDLPLNALRAFAAVYDAGGVRPAARRLAVSHSSVSRHLRELEAWLGTTLLESRPGFRSLAFTPQGEALGRAALASLGELSEAVAALREAKSGNAVTLATTPSLAARWLLPRLHDLHRRYPWIELSVVAEQKLADPTGQGADLCIRMGKGPWPNLSCEVLMDDELYPVAAPHWLAKQGRRRKLAGLRGLRLLHDRDPQAAWQRWLRKHPESGVDLRQGPRFESSDLVLRAAAQGLGLALARGRLAAEDVAHRVLLRPFGGDSCPLPDAYWIIRPMAARQRQAVDRVVDWLRQQAEAEMAPRLPGEGSSP